MRALTIRQPWAEWVAAGIKDIENRPGPTNFRGTIAIHAGVAFDGTAPQFNGEIHRGMIIGVVDIADCVRDANSAWAEDGEWHWVLRNARRLERPIPCRGMLGLWRVTPQAERDIAQQLGLGATDVGALAV